MIMKNVVGRKVKLARMLKNPPMTQQELATQLQLVGFEINRSGIAKIEAGIRQVRDVEALRLAEALQVEISWLFEDTNL
jgi:transcriptional regulator with XRE-family HTH domain